MKSTLFLLFILAFGSSFSQDNYDSRLLSKFSEERILELQQDHSSVLDYWSFYLDHSYEIVDMPLGKMNSDLPEIDVKKKKQFNILDYDLKGAGEQKTIYRLKGTNQILILHSASEIAQAFNEYRQTPQNQ
jgi:hypothetical protein